MSNLVIVSNILIEHHIRTIIKKNVNKYILFNNIECILLDDIMNEHKKLSNADVIVFIINFDVLYPSASNTFKSDSSIIEKMEENLCSKCYTIFSHIKQEYPALVIWFGFEDYYLNRDVIYGNIYVMNGLIDRINQKIYSFVQESGVFIDFKRLIARIGIDNSIDKKGKYRWNAPYSCKLVAFVLEEINKQYFVFCRKTPKCLVIDCDNVLWGGILSEDGIEGIQISNSGLGRQHQDFQRFLLEMYYHGVILTVCSKNDEVDVLNVFRKHSGMLLKEEHISCFRCNWDNKPDNIKAIADILNIGLDSMVFVDDSQFEIELVKNVLPDVTPILYHRDTVYPALSCFNLRTNTNLQTIKERTSTYRTNVQREELKMNASSFDEYISSLNMKIDIHKTQEQELARLSELTQRTNKCTNGVRYTLEQLKARINKADYDLYTVCLSDRFSNLGIVGVMGISGQTIDLFSLSCRALGRNVENQMLFWLLEKHLYFIRYIKTGKNDTLKNLFESRRIKLIES